MATAAVGSTTTTFLTLQIKTEDGTTECRQLNLCTLARPLSAWTANGVSRDETPPSE